MEALPDLVDQRPRLYGLWVDTKSDSSITHGHSQPARAGSGQGTAQITGGGTGALMPSSVTHELPGCLSSSARTCGRISPSSKGTVRIGDAVPSSGSSGLAPAQPVCTAKTTIIAVVLRLLRQESEPEICTSLKPGPTSSLVTHSGDTVGNTFAPARTCQAAPDLHGSKVSSVPATGCAFNLPEASVV
ncbi:hypothetical protein TREES_T100020661 [Tupaia chinensis]|uniref:Uncharacterized protein n=1 Tax=Tupaia chinensis TaxID=246437 RepID=L9KLC0_TUPCH|nr:hypothetical protein TREES_T100020661 [Tupaia chinensis]